MCGQLSGTAYQLPLRCQYALKQLRNTVDMVSGGGKLSPSALLHA